MTVIAMSRTEIDRMSVLRDLAKVAEAPALMRLGRRGQGLQPAIPPPRPAEQPLLPFGFTHCSRRHHPGAFFDGGWSCQGHRRTRRRLLVAAYHSTGSAATIDTRRAETQSGLAAPERRGGDPTSFGGIT